MQDTTHLVYAALYEAPNLIDGWRDPDQIRTNDLMLRNLMAVLEPVAPALRHVALLQGTKAYGVHVRPLTVPAREGRSEMYEQPNFYWAQENFLRELQQGKAWHWSILRPVLIVGEAMGGAMDLIPPLGVYAAMLREQGRRARLSRRCRAGVAGGRRRSAGARHRLVGRGGGGAQRSLQRHQWRRLHLGECLAGDCGCAGNEAGRTPCRCRWRRNIRNGSRHGTSCGASTI